MPSVCSLRKCSPQHWFEIKGTPDCWDIGDNEHQTPYNDCQETICGINSDTVTAFSLLKPVYLFSCTRTHDVATADDSEADILRIKEAGKKPFRVDEHRETRKRRGNGKEGETIG
eukprot:scaffold896_cov172-Amphora_coffeaeformis.AAC.16